MGEHEHVPSIGVMVNAHTIVKGYLNVRDRLGDQVDGKVTAKIMLNYRIGVWIGYIVFLHPVTFV
jgi:hypothetical protein